MYWILIELMIDVDSDNDYSFGLLILKIIWNQKTVIVISSDIFFHN